MRNYEGVFIINTDLSAENAKGVVAQIQELVSKHGGRIDGIQERGRKRFAYKIKKKHEGNYVIMNFQIDSNQTKKLDQSLRLNDHLLRFLLVNKDAL
ncbi:MAG: 30S ribosomal protein S6 [Candidatus Omnitrophica bacterium CG07_land_8_20_14_0_80_50_8]|nr:MAG: 30S ribosomal protein S6 [Candidatus Omnitrophica bacterium CG1_02_49_16]PIU40278.1 MAG: 30S ribosomal protein S6 [Candidatus Omnitrophica bacterium CG07_land_8_20_14_0_80_50_8]